MKKRSYLFAMMLVTYYSTMVGGNFPAMTTFDVLDYDATEISISLADLTFFSYELLVSCVDEYPYTVGISVATAVGLYAMWHHCSWFRRLIGFESQTAKNNRLLITT